MTRPPIVVILKPRRLSAEPVKAAAEQHEYTPKPKLSAMEAARFWLVGRLEERGERGYFLDGRPADLAAIMRETNRLIEASGAEQILTNPKWRWHGE